MHGGLTDGLLHDIQSGPRLRLGSQGKLLESEVAFSRFSFVEPTNKLPR